MLCLAKLPLGNTPSAGLSGLGYQMLDERNFAVLGLLGNSSFSEHYNFWNMNYEVLVLVMYCFTSFSGRA
jgi:hypothetical protein